MSEEEIKELAKIAYEELMMCSESERDMEEKEDPYKPFYRTVAILTTINGCGVPNEALSKGNMKRVMLEMHPWYKDWLESHEWLFENLYGDMFDTWHIHWYGEVK
jgi:hypothetical protein